MNTLTQSLGVAAEDETCGLRFVDRHGEDQWYSWRDVQTDARRVAGSLRGIGIVRADTVALFYPTCSDFFAAFFGVLLAGAIPVPFFPPIRFGQISEYGKRSAKMIAACNAKHALVDASLCKSLQGLVNSSGISASSIAELPDHGEAVEEVGADDLALIQFSSGTILSPKPVALTHKALIAQARILNNLWPDRGERPTGCAWLPMYHDMGLVGCVLPALLKPSELTLLSPDTFAVRPAMWLKAISRFRAQVSPAPNFAYRWCVENIKDEELTGVDLSCWHVALNGAESVSCKVMRRFIERFEPFGFRAEAMTPVYGLAEASLAVTFSDVEALFTSNKFDRESLRAHYAEFDDDGMEIASVGTPVAGFEVEIRDAEGQVLQPQEIGTVWTRGPSLMREYLGNEEATNAALVDGWLNTGDLGFIFEANLYISGRAKDVLIVRGRNYAPEEIEFAVDGIAGVRSGSRVAVSIDATEENPEQVWLLIERASGTKPKEDDNLIDACCREVLAETGIELDRVVILGPGELLRTSSGKIRRRDSLHHVLETKGQ